MSAKLVLTFADRGCCVVSSKDTHGRILGFLDRSRYYFFHVAPQLYSRGWVDPVPDSLLLRKSGSAGNRTRDFWICSQELWPLDQRGGLTICIWNKYMRFIPSFHCLGWSQAIILPSFLRRRKSNRHEEKWNGGNKAELFTSVRESLIALDIVCLSVLLHRQLRRLEKLRGLPLICERLQNGKCCMLDEKIKMCREECFLLRYNAD
jgi:hypothetical protein